VPDFHHLKAWQHAKQLAIECARAAAMFPPEERFALADQLRRAAYSAALNVAEGSSRRGTRDHRKFLDTARASLSEVAAILEIAADLDYLPSTVRARLEARRDEAAKTVYGLLRAVTAKADREARGNAQRCAANFPPRTPAA
jgi:four helix bundle protein